MSILNTLGKLLKNATSGPGNAMSGGVTVKSVPSRPAAVPTMVHPSDVAAQPPAAVAPVAPKPAAAAAQLAPMAPTAVDPSDLTALLQQIANQPVAATGPTPSANDIFSQLASALPAAPNKDAYLAPYVQAEGQANKVYQEAQPIITGAYDQLRQQLAQAATQGAADNSKRAADAAAQRGTVEGQVNGIYDGVQGDLAKQGVIPQLMGAVQQMAAAQQANMKMQGGQQAQLFQDMGARAAQDNSERGQTAGLAQAAATANSRNNLDAMLNQIGLGKAGAEKQYQGALEQRAQQENALRLQAQSTAGSLAKQSADAATEAAKQHVQAQIAAAQARHSDAQDNLKSTQQYEKAYQQSLISPKDQLQKTMADRAVQFPKATHAFEDIVKAAGSGGGGVGKAMTILQGWKGDPKGFAQAFGFTPDGGSFATLEDWLRAYYDTDKKVLDPDKFQQLSAGFSPAGASPAAAPAASLAAGQLQAGNIDLNARPVVHNANGSISTVRSVSFNVDGHEVLVPTVSDDGRILSDQDALQQFFRTGKHLGIFATPEAADAYAQQLHNDQAQLYAGR